MTAARPRAVVFDCDGTLMDTLPCADAAYDAMFARRGRTCPEDVRTALTGLAMGDAGEVLAAGLGEDAAAPADELNAELAAALGALARPLPGAQETVRAAAGALPVAIAGNSFRALLDKTLAAGGLAALVPVTVAGDEVARPKPAPDSYLAACAASAAGLAVAGIGTPASCPGADMYVTCAGDPAPRARLGLTGGRA